MKNISIAVVIPVYNKEPCIAEAISSVLTQTSPVDEIIIVDDGSTDGSRAQVEAFQDKRIKFFVRSEPGAGGYAARNLGIQQASARWIAFLDADDCWREHFVEELNHLMARASEQTVCLFTGFERIWPGKPAQRDPYSARFGSDEYNSIDFDSFLGIWVALGACPIWTSATAVRRDILINVGLFPDGRCSRGGDKDVWLRAMTCGDALSSPRICATHNKETVNQLTRTVRTHMRHCLCSTLETMIHASSGMRRRQLMRIFNHEVFEYARLLNQEKRVSPETYRGFYVSLNPFRYFVLLALSHSPLSFQKFVRRIVLWFRRRRLRTDLNNPNQPRVPG